MIFFFTGTGNSEYTASKIADKTDSCTVSISESIKVGTNKFYLPDGEALGFVFPVHAWSVPEIVLRFIRTMELENYSGQYVFAVFTCGASIGTAYEDLRKALADRGITLNYARDLIMPENYIVMFKTAQPKKQEEIFAASEVVIEEITGAVAAGTEEVVISGRNPMKFFARILNYFFRKYALGTQKFYATSRCVSCGLCERICPESVIKMEEGRPRWSEARCAKCMGCINRCPAQAIEHGRATRKRRRYVNPIYSNRG